MKIPKIIHFTCKDKTDINNPIWKKCLEKYYNMYKNNYIIKIHDNNDIYNIIETHFPKYLDKIKQIHIGALLADIFRYLILYLEGGIYSDLDCEPIKNLDELFDPNYIYFHGDENRNNNYYIYKDNKTIVNKKWDFYNNICDNNNIINKSCNPNIMRCNGHKLNLENKKTILCYELHKNYHSNLKSKLLKDPTKTYKNLLICQWFLISEPKQEIFLKMFLYCMNNIDKLINIKKDDNYQYNVINMSGPLGFTKVVLNNYSKKILILPCDFFCQGSFCNVPHTKNSFIKHNFTNSWLK
jgi:mannosyltransferase OCH1-like enzyme